MVLNELAEKMRRSDPTRVRALIGFDGFVDTVVYPVDTRTGPDEYERIKTLADYGSKFIHAAGLSMNLEMVPGLSKLGGISAILANSLATLGFRVTFIGAMGKEAIHPAFKAMAENTRAYSISDPGITDAVEFYDGKVISCKLEPLKDVNWENLMKKLTPQEIADILDQSDFIGYGGWTLTINVMSIWRGILDEAVPLMKSTDRKWMLFDLSDPAKRTRKDILEALACVKEYAGHFRVIMGFNEKESYEIAELYGAGKEELPTAEKTAAFLREKLGLEMVIVHPVREAAAAAAAGSCTVRGPYCEKPKLTTGAGDNFNAGFSLGLMMGFSMEESLLMGTANSGYYVRNAHSANYRELCDFMDAWAAGNEDR